MADIFPISFSNSYRKNIVVLWFHESGEVFFPKIPFENGSALIPVIFWHQGGDKPSLEGTRIQFTVAICVARSHCVELTTIFDGTWDEIQRRTATYSTDVSLSPLWQMFYQWSAIHGFLSRLLPRLDPAHKDAMLMLTVYLVSSYIVACSCSYTT